MVMTETPYSIARSLWGGICTPTFMSPETMRRRISAATW